MSTYRRKAHTRNVNGKTVKVRAAKVSQPDPRVAWLDALFSKPNRDEDDDDPAIYINTAAHDGWQIGDEMCDMHRTGYSPGCMTCRRIAGLNP